MNAERASALQEQAWALRAEGKLNEALAAAQEALRLIEDVCGPQSPDAANLLNDLAEIEIDRQHLPLALQLAERARAIEDVLGANFRGPLAAQIQARTLTVLGAIRRAQ